MVTSNLNVADMQEDRKDADLYHQTYTSKIYECDNKTCYNKHPKNWRHWYTCQCQTKCFYNHKKNNKERTEEHSKEIKKITEIALLNTELNIKVSNIL